MIMNENDFDDDYGRPLYDEDDDGYDFDDPYEEDLPILEDDDWD